jgi:antitoxin (DNA-binding transcriptional repressor) of toxin-antitoxin stability system
MQKVNIEDAQRRLPELIDEAASGEDVVISRGDGATFRLVPVPEPETERRPRQAGSMRGKIRMSDDFDDPLDDFAPYM